MRCRIGIQAGAFRFARAQGYIVLKIFEDIKFELKWWVHEGIIQSGKPKNILHIHVNDHSAYGVGTYPIDV